MAVVAAVVAVVVAAEAVEEPATVPYQAIKVLLRILQTSIDSTS